MSKSTDERVTQDLIETLRDGEKGFLAAADKVADSTRADLASQFREISQQRGKFADELEALAQSYGDDIDETGSLAGAMHRGWMAIKDVVSGDDPDGVVSAVSTGEEHAVTEYEKALAEDISDHLRTVVTRQLAQIKPVRARFEQLDDVLN